MSEGRLFGSNANIIECLIRRREADVPQANVPFQFGAWESEPECYALMEFEQLPTYFTLS